MMMVRRRLDGFVTGRESRLDPAMARTRFLLLPLALGMLGGCVVFYSMSSGVGLMYDSARYLSAALNLARGDGFSQSWADTSVGFRVITEIPLRIPVTMHPPFFPWILSLFTRLGCDPSTAARFLNAGFFTANVATLGGIVACDTGGKAWVALMSCLTILLSRDMLTIHSAMLSEPLFLFLSLPALWLLSRHLRSSNRAHLFLSSALTATALMTRYAGMALCSTGVSVLCLFGSGTPRKKIAESAIYVSLPALVCGCWAFRNLSTAGNLAHRTLAWHPFGVEEILLTVMTAAGWFIPVDWDLYVKDCYRLASGKGFYMRDSVYVAACVCGLSLLWTIWKNGSSRGAIAVSMTSRVLLVYIAQYVLLFIGYSLCADAATPPYFRILAPVYIAVVILFYTELIPRIALLAWRQRVFAAVLGLVFYSGQSLRAVEWVTARQRARNVFFPVSANWLHAQPLLQGIKSLDASIPIYSNRADYMYVVTGRSVGILPPRFNHYTLSRHSPFESQMRELRDALSGGGVVVYFGDSVLSRRDPKGASSPLFPLPSEIQESLSLEPVRRQGALTLYAASAQKRRIARHFERFLP